MTFQILLNQLLFDCSLGLNENGDPTGQVEIYLSQALMGEHTAADFQATPQRITWISTEKPSEVALHAQQLGLVVHSVADAQDEALINIRAQKSTEDIIAIVLLFLLGINLYSTFPMLWNDVSMRLASSAPSALPVAVL